MDITYQYLISEINNSEDKNTIKVLSFVKRVNEHISGLRLTATKMKGTSVGNFCAREANYLEKKLLMALEKKNEPERLA
jgi:hypothetical protein